MSWRRPAVLLWLGALLAPAQRPDSYLYPIREGNKFGFIDRTGSVVVAPKYAAVGEIREGRIRVTEGQVSGYIDLSGKLVIDPKYDSAGEFRGSRAVVRQKRALELLGKELGLFVDRTDHTFQWNGDPSTLTDEQLAKLTDHLLSLACNGDQAKIEATRKQIEAEALAAAGQVDVLQLLVWVDW